MNHYASLHIFNQHAVFVFALPQANFRPLLFRDILGYASQVHGSALLVQDGVSGFCPYMTDFSTFGSNNAVFLRLFPG